MIRWMYQCASSRTPHGFVGAGRLEHPVALLIERAVEQPARDPLIVHHQDRRTKRREWNEHGVGLGNGNASE